MLRGKVKLAGPRLLARKQYLRSESNMQMNSINSQKNVESRKKIQSTKIVKLKSDKFAEAPLVRKLKNALLIKIQEKFPPVGDLLTCSANHRAPEQSLMHTIDAIRDEVVSYIDLMVEHRRSMSQASRTQLREAVRDEIFGFGPLGVLLRNPSVANIYVEGSTRVFVEKFLPRGERRIEQLRLPFRDEGHVLDVINRILVPLGFDLSESNPSISGKLPNGNAIYATVPPVSVHGPTLSILCKELIPLDVLPHWNVCYRDGDQPPVFSNESAPGQDDFRLCVAVPADSGFVQLTQLVPARSLRGKTVRFAGAVEVENLPNLDEDQEVDISTGYLPYMSLKSWAGRQNQQKCCYSKTELSWQVPKNGWHNFSCTLIVPREALNLEIFFSLNTSCISKIKNLSFEIVANEKKEVFSSRLRLPKNLILQCVRPE